MILYNEWGTLYYVIAKIDKSSKMIIPEWNTFQLSSSRNGHPGMQRCLALVQKIAKTDATCRRKPCSAWNSTIQASGRAYEPQEWAQSYAYCNYASIERRAYISFEYFPCGYVGQCWLPRVQGAIVNIVHTSWTINFCLLTIGVESFYRTQTFQEYT